MCKLFECIQSLCSVVIFQDMITIVLVHTFLSSDDSLLISFFVVAFSQKLEK